MASVLCNKCKMGIHYHSEPQGIEYVYIDQNDWEDICNSAFDTKSKIMDDNGYPKLYKTDTLEDDFKDRIVKVWRCPNCGSIIKFDREGNVMETYEVSSENDLGNYLSEGLCFDDYLWDEITEEACPNRELSSKKPSLYVKVFTKGILVVKEGTEKVQKYVAM